MNGELTVLNDYPPEKFNTLMAATATTMAEGHRIVVCQVKIDPTVGNGDVYPQTGGLAFHKQTLMRLADAAGIRFTGNDNRRHDDFSVTHTAYGKMRKADGMEHDLIGTYTWDVPVREEQTRIDAEKKGRKATAQDLLNVRKYAYMRAETGAMERLVRAALGLKSTYSPADLAKPFALARVVKDESQDPVSRIVRAITEAGGTVGAEAITAIIAAMGVQPQPVMQIEQAAPVAELAAGDVREVEPEPQVVREKTAESSNGDVPWIEDKTRRGHFWAWAKELGLSNGDVHKALDVSTLKGWNRPLDETKQLIQDFIGTEIAEGEPLEQGEF